MKSRETFVIDKDIMNKFNEFSIKEDLNKSTIVESLIKEFLIQKKDTTELVNSHTVMSNLEHLPSKENVLKQINNLLETDYDENEYLIVCKSFKDIDCLENNQSWFLFEQTKSPYIAKGMVQIKDIISIEDEESGHILINFIDIKDINISKQ